MQRILVIMALFALTVPAMAAGSNITVTLSGDGSGNVTLSYTTDANVPRAFALNIVSDNDVNLVNVQPVNEPNQEKDFWVYPGSIDIIDNDVNDYGTPKGNAARYPGTYSGNKAMTIEMGSLYVGDGNRPSKSGDLVTFQVEGSNFCIDVNENLIRGGIVMEDPNEEPNSVTFVGYCEIGCFPSCHPDYQAWLDVNSPECWCYPRQCHADADGLQEGGGKEPIVWVGINDLNVLIPSWKKNPGDAGFDICADFDHAEEGGGKEPIVRVGINDLNILITNWKDKIGPPSPDCLDCP